MKTLGDLTCSCAMTQDGEVGKGQAGKGGTAESVVGGSGGGGESFRQPHHTPAIKVQPL